MADLYTLTLQTGAIFRYTSADRNIVLSGNTFSAQGPRIKRGKTRIVIGLEVDTLDLSVFADSTAIVGAQSFFQLAVSGGLDGGTLRLDRVFMPTWGDTSPGAVNMFYGRIADIKIGRTEAKITVKSMLELLDIQMPRNIYQPSCLHTLFDAGCALNPASFAVTATVEAGATTLVIPTNLADPYRNDVDGHPISNYFTDGKIVFSDGTQRSVRAYVGGQFTIYEPLILAPTNGSTFTAYPGCDRSLDTCRAKFQNSVHFRGYPFVPAPEAAI